mgnify:FL=1|tara:strand:+ start:50 stop:601 length:552 start_codon:yes stop_codon:yes gene_type:complete
MPHCKYCNHSYKGHKDEHERSKIHLTNEREWYKKYYHNHLLRKDLSIQDNIDIQANYQTIEEDFLDTMTETEHSCGNYKMCGTITDNFIDCLEHESECLHMERPIITFDNYQISPITSVTSVTCEDCGHIFTKSPKGVNPIHLLKRHKTSGRCARRIRRYIKDVISECNDKNKLIQIRNILKQ